MKKWVRVLAIVLFMAFVLSVTVCAKHFYSTFDTIELTDDEKQTVWSNIALQYSDDKESFLQYPRPIVDFDVSETGLIVLALSGDRIIVLDDEEMLLHCFLFDTEGLYHVFWYREHIVLYIVRSDLLIEFSVDGELIDMVKRDRHSTKSWDALKEWERGCVRESFLDLTLQQLQSIIHTVSEMNGFPKWKQKRSVLSMKLTVQKIKIVSLRIFIKN